MSNVADKIAVMQAFEDGVAVEMRGRSSGDWRQTNVPIWNWASFDYRVAPQPPEREPREWWLGFFQSDLKDPRPYLYDHEPHMWSGYGMIRVVELLPGWEVRRKGEHAPAPAPELPEGVPREFEVWVDTLGCVMAASDYVGPTYDWVKITAREVLPEPPQGDSELSYQEVLAAVVMDLESELDNRGITGEHWHSLIEARRVLAEGRLGQGWEYFGLGEVDRCESDEEMADIASFDQKSMEWEYGDFNGYNGPVPHHKALRIGSTVWKRNRTTSTGEPLEGGGG